MLHQTLTVEQTQNELNQAKEQLQSMSLIDRMVGKKAAFEAEIQAKETSLKEATDALEEIKRKKSTQPIDPKEQDKKLEHTTTVTAHRTAQYKQEQGEALALQAQLESRNNIEKIIGAITGKTREQQRRIEELQGNIKSYEADKRLDEIKQQQVDRARQDAESKQRDKDRSNDNKVEVTKEQRIETEKQKYLDDMAREREEKDRQEAIKKGYDYQPMSERRENDMSLTKEERKQSYIERMDKQVEQEAAHQEYKYRPENNPDLSREERQQAYLDRISSEREQKLQSPEIDKGRE